MFKSLQVVFKGPRGPTVILSQSQWYNAKTWECILLVFSDPEEFLAYLEMLTNSKDTSYMGTGGSTWCWWLKPGQMHLSICPNLWTISPSVDEFSSSDIWPMKDNQCSCCFLEPSSQPQRRKILLFPPTNCITTIKHDHYKLHHYLDQI